VRFVAAAIATLIVAGSAFAQTIDGGSDYTVILKSDGTVWTFGLNSSGQLGDGTTTMRPTPVQVSGLTDIVAVAAGQVHSMAITSTGSLYVWGSNAYGQIGDGTTTQRSSPVQSTLTNVVAIAAGNGHSLALRSNGDIYAWGLNGNGQLGTGNTTQQTSPVLVATGGAAIAAGAFHSIFVKSDGSVYATGLNSYGALGDASTTQRTTAVQMSGISTAVAAAAGDFSSLILLSDGTMKGCGYNGQGSIGDGTTTDRSTPVAVSSLTGITAIAAGAYHSLARKSDGTMYSWGYDNNGQLGDGNSVQRTTPWAISSLSSIDKIGAGAYHSIAVSSTGVVSTWGANNSSQLGDGSTIPRSTPGAISDTGYDWFVAMPTFNVAAGTYTSTFNVTVATATSGATIYYTLNGVDPTTSDSTVASGSTVAVTISETLKAKAFKTGMPASLTKSAAYVLKPATPGFSPSGGTYTVAQNVSISSGTSGATIRYTTDGTTPTTTSTLYTSPISVGTTTVFKAIAFKTDWDASAVGSGSFAMNFGTLATPSADQATGNYVDTVTVALSVASGATIRYTTNNTAVQTNSTVYTVPLVIDVTTTLRFKAYHPDYQPSSEVTRTYTLAPAAPVFNPTAGSFTAGQLVTVTEATTGATTRYTLNGADPTTTDPLMVSGSTLVVGNYTLKAKAFKTGTNASATTTAVYSITGTVAPPALAAGSEYSLAIRADGTAWGWGKNGYGQTGSGTTTSPQKLPKIMSGVTGAAAVEGGDSHTHVLSTSGTLAAMGNNASGRLGDGTTTDRLLATSISGITGVVAIADGDDHTVALKGDGTVSAWGNNTYGQIGDGTTTNRISPTTISSLSSVAAIGAGSRFSVALKQNGTLAAWGLNGNGQLGNSTTTNSSSPVSVSSISTATAVSAGWLHVLALLSDGTVRAWGYNFYGQLGDGTTTSRSTPVQVAGLDHVIAVRAGAGFSLALRDDGTVWAWGENGYGQLGDGTTSAHTSPAQVSTLSDIVQIAAGYYHALAMTSDGSVFAWGFNSSGQLGDGTTTSKLTPVQISGPDMGWRVPAPTLSLASGLYYATQSVTVTGLDPDATLRYTTTGADPTSTDAPVTSGGSLSITQSQTLKVSAWKTGFVTSLAVAGDYELKAVTPTLTPGAGFYGASQSVSIATTTSGATLRYTTDGTEPTSSSSSYSSAITIANTSTVKARAYKTGWTSSETGYASYSISGGTVATPTITPAGGTQTVAPLVAMTTSTTGATIRYTLDGSTPTSSSAVFVYPFLVNATTTVKSKAFKAGYTASGVASTTFDVDASTAAGTPTIAPAGGWFATQQVVTISGVSGATLRYTTDGTDPTTSSTSISSGNTITVNKSQIVKVRAWATGVDPSAVRRADFVITGALETGSLHSVALASDGKVWTWGGNFNGQLGTGTMTSSTVPVQALTGAMAVAAGSHHTLAVRTDGSVWAWGEGSAGKLGNGNSFYNNNYPTPAQITFSGAIAVAGGMEHSLVLKSDGTVWAFGENSQGEIGDGTTTMRTTAVQVTGLTGVVAIAASRNSSYALQSDGAGGGILWAWGSNQYGELGDGSTVMRTTPVRVLGISNASAITASKVGYFALAVGGDGGVYGWGQNNEAQLGVGDTSNRSIATRLPVIRAARLISAGTQHSVAADATSRTWAWGYANTSALGVGPLGSPELKVVPEQSDITTSFALVAGDSHTLALQPDGSVKGYGANGYGQLGTGTTFGTTVVAVTVSGLSLADNSFLTGDQDNDHLVTWREYLAGTDPLNPDTNGNGVADGYDASVGTDALDPDSDDDGVPNWIEQRNGTDPFRADTDGDGVSDLNDAFPLDPSRSMAASSNPSDTTPPLVTLKAPVSARLIP
jgi:alpha-tubulin suppressor-like RCC1 family protein